MISQIFKDLARNEGFSKKPYHCPSGKLTIGYGRNLEDVGISKKEAEVMLYYDVMNIMEDLDRKVNFWLKKPVAVKCVLVQMAYQLGINGLLSFKKFLNALQNDDYPLAIKEMYDSKWAVQTPNRVKFLEDIIKRVNTYGSEKLWDNDRRIMINIEDCLNNFYIFE
jgi:lysozyme